MTPITFGTDGWRGIIADTFTQANVERVARAYGVYLQQNGLRDQGVVVGYDARFLSDRMAGYVANVLSNCGAKVWLSNRICTTPSVSHAVVELGAAGGVMVTASHNPAEYNGIKFKASYGGSASPEEVERIAEWLDKEPNPTTPAPIEKTDIIALYERRLKASAPAPEGRPLRIVVDPMHGAGARIAAAMLQERGHEIIEIHGSRDVLFGGLHPEPIPPHLNQLGDAVREYNADLGVAVDGDADRIGAVTAQGEFFSSHQIFALLAYAQLNAGESGRIVKTVSTTSMLDRIGEAFHVPVTTTPIGFKHIASEIERGDVLIGGEESGGLWVRGEIPE
ncbi:MAG: phosphoglucomutase/phosphomannomutase family protein, partial [Candidatus Poribacteria bacterium]|nr:phosphoglucomutase/phosphomannomutase family protein [Candidatus Poribacteria bacterium]